jgi:hypothetical protein
MLVPSVLELESRRLLSLGYNYLGYTGVDLTGPTAAPGPDGTQDLHIQITGLSILNPNSPNPTVEPINAVTITGPPGFTWTYGDPPSAPNNPNQEDGPGIQVLLTNLDTGTGDADIYFSPVVQQIGGTGTITDVPVPDTYDNAPTVLNVSVYYNQSNQPYTFSIQSGAPFSFSPAPTDSTPIMPTLAYATYATFQGQSATTGLASIQIADLPASSTLTNVVLSDVAGLEWGVGQSYARGELGISVTSSQNDTVQTIYFPPYRDEAGTTMTLTYQLTGSSTEYVTDVAVPSSDHTNPALLNPPSTSAFDYPSPWTNTDPYSPPLELEPASDDTATDPNSEVEVVSTGATPDFETLINNDASGEYTSGEYEQYNNFELTSGTYYLNEILDIQDPMKIWAAPGSDVNIIFTFSSTANVGDANPSQLFGAINIRSSHVWLEDFGISFSQSNVSLGGGGYTLGAIIDDQNTSQTARVDVNIIGLTIHGALETQDQQSPNQGYFNEYDPNSYMTMPTVIMGDFDSGTIENNTIYGGEVDVSWGPWTISGNQIIGSVPGTINTQAFAVGSGHDITIDDNTLTDPDPAEDGQLERLMTGSNGGYDINILGNNVSDNVGDLVVDGATMNTPEMIAPEDYGTVYEGSTDATTTSSSSNGTYTLTVIAIPSNELFDEIPGPTSGGVPHLVLFILDGASAGMAIPVAQEFASEYTSGQPTYDSTTYFVLPSPLPQGTFDFSIAPTYNDFTVSGNTINTSGTVSEGLVIEPNFNDVQVTNNTFIGDTTTGPNGQSEAIRISDWGAGSLGGVPSYESTESTPLNSSYGGNSGYQLSLTYMFGVNIADNTIDDPIMGIDVYVAMGQDVPTTYGRTYTFVTMTDNTFNYNYSSSDLSVIHTGDNALAGTENYPDTYSTIVNGTVEYDSYAKYFVDPRDMSVTMSGNTIDWVGVSPAPNAVELDSAEVNGSPYDGSSYATPSPPLLSAASSPILDLSPGVNLSVDYNLTGIYADGADFSSTGGLDGVGDALSANLLGRQLAWNGPSFSIGPAGADDVVSARGQVIPLPSGSFSQIMFLAVAVEGDQTDQTFTVNYTDGTSTQFTQSFSDWFTPQGYAGESIAAAMPYRDTYSGGEDSRVFNVYGYADSLDVGKTIASITLPDDPDVEIIAIDLVNAGLSAGAAATALSPAGSDVFKLGADYGFSYAADTTTWSSATWYGLDVWGVTAIAATYFDSVAYGFAATSTGVVEDQVTSSTPTGITTGLGGVPASALAAVSTGSDIYVFEVGVADSSVYVDEYNGSTWSGWTDLGGLGLGGSFSSISAVLAATPEVFVSNSSGIYQSVLSGSGWSSLASIGMAPSTTPTAISATTLSNNNLYVFELGSNGQVYEETYTGSAWTSWDALTGAAFSSISAVGASTYAEIYAVNASGVYEDGNSGGSWSGWNDLGGGPSTAVWATGSAGNSTLFETSATGAVYEEGYTATGGSGWTYLGGGSSTATSTATIGNTAYLFMLGSNGGLYFDDGSGSSWSGWTYLGNDGSAGFTSISALADGSEPQVFAVNSSGLYEAAYYNSTWNWAVQGPGGDEVSVINDFPDQYAFVLGAGGTLSVDSYNGTSWSSASLASVGDGFTSISAVLSAVGEPQVYAVNSSGLYEVAYYSSAWHWAVQGPGGDEVSVINGSGYIVYAFVLGPGGMLSVDTYNGTSWNSTNLESFVNNATFTSISAVLSAADQPQVFAVNSSGFFEVVYYSSTWNSGPPGTTGGDEISVVDGSGYTVYAFLQSSSGAVTLLYYNGSEWTSIPLY